METKLNGIKVAIISCSGFEDSELLEPKRALEEAGAKAQVISPEKGEITGKKGAKVKVDMPLEQAEPGDYEALLLPGGVVNADRIRTEPKAVEFTKAMAADGKPIAAICHGPWLLIEAGAVRGKNVTSWPSLKTDLKNAGARWADREVCVDQGLVTSRKPEDLPAFCAKMVEEIHEGRHVNARSR